MSKLTPPVNDNDHKQGDQSKAKIVLLEYGDYQCPYCGEAYPIIKKLQKKFSKDLLFIFRNFPLQDAHPDAYNAALSAEAANLQGKFWEMHDTLYERQDKLDWKSIAEYANAIGLDLKRFESDIESGKLQTRIDSDLESGLRSGVNGTPSFFIDGAKYNGDWSYDGLENVLSAQLSS